MAYVDWDPEDLESTPPAPAPEPAADRSRSNRARLAGAALALVAVLVVVAVVVSGGDGDPRPATVTTTDDFPESRPSLDGAALDGLRWQVTGGIFSTDNGAASGRTSGAHPVIAVVAPPRRPTAVAATFSRVGSESGVVFRWVDDRNYWSVVAASAYGTWNINKMVGGRLQFVANTGNNLVPDNTAIEVRDDGRTFTVLVDGRPSMRVTDGALAAGTGAGMLATARDQGITSWTSLTVRRDTGNESQ